MLAFIFHTPHCGANRKTIPITIFFFFHFQFNVFHNSSTFICFDSGNEATAIDVLSDKFMSAFS